MKPIKVVFAWENLGPSHFDRIEACAAAPGLDVTAIEFFGTSIVYDWNIAGPAGPVGVRRITLFPDGRSIHHPLLVWRLIKACLSAQPGAVFLCHYNLPSVFLAALVLQLLGIRTITMIDSKFDDYPRSLALEAIKAILLAPYNGAMVASRRSADYMHFLGFKRRPISLGFDSLSLSRLTELGPEVSSLPHAERDFLIVARLVPKKNLSFAIEAFAAWQKAGQNPRNLRVIGYGEQETALRNLAAQLGLEDTVIFEGKADSARVASAMQQSLCLILPSTEEQFGLVVIEALALGLPVLVSTNAGAVDGLIDNGVNGWLVDPYRPAGLIAAMALFDGDEDAWLAASVAASASSERGDVRHFVNATKALLQPG